MMDIVIWWAESHCSSHGDPLHRSSWEQQVWSLGSLGVPLGQLYSRVLSAATGIQEHEPNEGCLKTIEIHNSFRPSLPVCIGKLYLAFVK
jgi:hypothetical protein